MKKYLFVSTVALAAFMFSCNSDAPASDATDVAPATTVVEPASDPAISADPIITPAIAMATTAMSIDRPEHDFGKIPDTAPVETSFVITNNGDKPLLITNAQGSCGCTVPEYPKEPIAPGESRDMKVSFNPSGKEGVNNKTVTITANTEPATTIINIKSDVQKTAE
ncbi:MAG: hypothetical protein ACI9O4_001057 [Chitinophagales bacterium]|jgi:hypothetical protein